MYECISLSLTNCFVGEASFSFASQSLLSSWTASRELVARVAEAATNAVIANAGKATIKNQFLLSRALSFLVGGKLSIASIASDRLIGKCIPAAKEDE